MLTLHWTKSVLEVYQNDNMVVKVGVMGDVKFIDPDGEVRCYWGKIGKPFANITIDEIHEWVVRRNRLVNGYCRYWG